MPNPDTGTTPVVAAFDLGLKRTGIAWAGDSDVYCCPNKYHTSPINDQKVADRLSWWWDSFYVALLPFANTGATVAFEGAVMQSGYGQSTMRITELHGVFRLACGSANISIVTVAPKALKKWATGNGNANKDDMIEAARNMGCDTVDDNEADAWLLYTMCNTKAAA